MEKTKSIHKEKLPDEKIFTSDFKRMIRIIALNSLGFFYLQILLPLIAANTLNASKTEVGFMFSLQITGYALSSPFVGWKTDKISKKKLIAIGSFGRGSAYFILYVAILINSFKIMVLSAFIIGFMVGFFWIPFDTLVSQKSLKEYRSYAFGKREFSTGLGILIGSVLGLLNLWVCQLNPGCNIKIEYISIPLFGIANILAGVLFLLVIDENLRVTEVMETAMATKDSSSTTTGSAHELIENAREQNKTNAPLTIAPQNSPNITHKSIRSQSSPKSSILVPFIFLFGALLFSAINGSMVFPFVQIYLVQEVGMSTTQAFIAYLPAGLIGFIFAPKLGQIGDKIPPHIAVSISSILGALVTYFVINTRVFYIFMLIFLCDKMIASTTGFVMQNFLSRISIQNRGKIFGIKSLFDNIGNIIGPILGGIIYDAYSGRVVFIITIFIELSLIPLFWIGMKKIMPYLSEQYDLDDHSSDKSEAA
ncbi:MAG: MFS transporter [Promethearchaeota archaeon]